MELFGGFGLLAPLAALLSALIIPILLLYMLRLRRTEVPISSNFLWQQLLRDREANAPWQRLRPNLLMLLQLLILLALIFALMRPYFEVKTIVTGRTVILLDASASMNATDVDGKTRFEAAQERALQEVSTLGADDTMTIIRVAEIPEVLVAASRDKTLLRRVIRDTEPSNATADWTAAFTLATAGSEGIEDLQVVALSDGGLPPNLPEIIGKFRYVKIGESGENVAITALSTRALPDDAPQMFASLKNYGDEDANIIFSIELDGDLYTATRYEILAGETRDIIIEDLPDNFATLKAYIAPTSSSDVPDYLPIDDVAYSVYNTSGTGAVLVMTERNIFLEHIFSSMPGAELTMRTPAEGLPSRDYDLYVFDGWLPARLPEGDLLIINPPESTNFFSVAGDTNTIAFNPDTGGVNREYEQARYLDFTNVNVRDTRVIERIDWANILVQTEEGVPLVFYGDVEGRQLAVISFDLHDSDLILQIGWPILVTNLMQWFQPQRAVAITDSVLPGTLITVRPMVDAEAVTLTRPDGKEVDYNLDKSIEVNYTDTNQLGLYEIEVLRNGNVIQKDAFAVNVFDANESFILPADSLAILQSDGETTVLDGEGETIGQREWWNYVAIFGLFLLVAEWWYYHRTRSQVRRQTSQMAYGTQRHSRAPRQWWRFWVRS